MNIRNLVGVFALLVLLLGAASVLAADCKEAVCGDGKCNIDCEDVKTCEKDCILECKPDCSQADKYFISDTFPDGCGGLCHGTKPLPIIKKEKQSLGIGSVKSNPNWKIIKHTGTEANYAVAFNDSKKEICLTYKLPSPPKKDIDIISKDKAGTIKKTTPIKNIGNKWCYDYSAEKLVKGDKLQVGTATLIMEYQVNNYIFYEFDWGNTSIGLVRQDNGTQSIDGLFIYKKNSTYEWGAYDYNSTRLTLKNYTMIYESTTPFIPIDNFGFLNDSNNTRFDYPQFFNIWQNSTDEFRQVYDNHDICNKTYANCQWAYLDGNTKVEINFTSDALIHPTITNVTGCRYLNVSDTNYNIISAFNYYYSGTCFLITADNITLTGNSYFHTGNPSDWFIKTNGSRNNITILNIKNGYDGKGIWVSAGLNNSLIQGASWSTLSGGQLYWVGTATNSTVKDSSFGHFNSYDPSSSNYVVKLASTTMLQFTNNTVFGDGILYSLDFQGLANISNNYISGGTTAGFAFQANGNSGSIVNNNRMTNCDYSRGCGGTTGSVILFQGSAANRNFTNNNVTTFVGHISYAKPTLNIVSVSNINFSGSLFMGKSAYEISCSNCLADGSWANYSNAGVLSVTGVNDTIQNFNLSGSESYAGVWTGSGAYGQNNNNLYKNIYVANTTVGLYLYGATNVTIDGASFGKIRYAPIYMWYYAQRNIIRNSIFASQPSASYQIAGLRSSTAQIINNTIYQQTTANPMISDTFDDGMGDGWQIINNTLLGCVSNAGFCIHLEGSNHITRNNSIFGTTSGQGIGLYDGSNNTFEDDVFNSTTAQRMIFVRSGNTQCLANSTENITSCSNLTTTGSCNEFDNPTNYWNPCDFQKCQGTLTGGGCGDISTYDSCYNAGTSGGNPLCDWVGCRNGNNYQTYCNEIIEQGDCQNYASNCLWQDSCSGTFTCDQITNENACNNAWGGYGSTTCCSWSGGTCQDICYSGPYQCEYIQDHQYCDSGYFYYLDTPPCTINTGDTKCSGPAGNIQCYTMSQPSCEYSEANSANCVWDGCINGYYSGGIGDCEQITYDNACLDVDTCSLDSTCVDVSQYIDGDWRVGLPTSCSAITTPTWCANAGCTWDIINNICNDTSDQPVNNCPLIDNTYTTDNCNLGTSGLCRADWATYYNATLIDGNYDLGGGIYSSSGFNITRLFKYQGYIYDVRTGLPLERNISVSYTDNDTGLNYSYANLTSNSSGWTPLIYLQKWVMWINSVTFQPVYQAVKNWFVSVAESPTSIEKNITHTNITQYPSITNPDTFGFHEINDTPRWLRIWRNAQTLANVSGIDYQGNFYTVGDICVNNTCGLTGNYSVGNCWQSFNGGIMYATNCSVI